LSDPSGGLKSYSYAGIKIKKCKNISDYEILRSNIIKMLINLKEPNTSKKLVKWAVKREELYVGEYIEKYPDVLFRLKDDWGISWQMNDSLYGLSYSHKLHSGNHRQDTAVFLEYGYNNFYYSKEANLSDIAPTVLYLLGVDAKFSFSGKNLFAAEANIRSKIHEDLHR
jgi:predicted AlkP superfamily phosphohydrolase/phosphomutase